MSIEALILYGSCARGDQEENSDVDLLAIYAESHYKTIINGKTNFTFYPIADLSKMMSSGELFAFHIFSEGKIIYDNNMIASDIINKFRFKKSYSNDIEMANYLGWFIIKFYDRIENVFLANKRMVWCIRTICAAMAASEKHPCFSAKAIARYMKDDKLEGLIKQKDSEKKSFDFIAGAKFFLLKNNLHEPLDIQTIKELSEGETLFKNNSVGMKFLKSALNGGRVGGYI